MNKLSLQMPERIERDEASYSSQYGKFVVQPLERGFGVTIGNVMRRVLLSSLHGAAITQIRVEGVLHEFSTIPGVVEDVSEVVLNIKQVRIKLLNKRPDRVLLHLKGPGTFKAGDIQKASPDLEILNPDMFIATLNEDADIKLELRIGRGRGYVFAEENAAPDQPIGTIPLDAVYNPIRKVKYTIENTRVGHRTDYERLILEVWTDGSITPDDALTYAGKIVKDHIALFIAFDVETEKE
ncbi:MAG TPA: DNA-directed RNA polymerase subunit alpha, partial [bacterium]